jgi:hypothetical protein
VEECTPTPNRTAPRTVHGRPANCPRPTRQNSHLSILPNFFFGLFVRLEPGFGNE